MIEAHNLRDLEALAAASMDPAQFAYYAGGSGDEVTLRENEAAFARQVGAALSAAGLDVTKTPLADLRLAAPAAPGRFTPAGEKAKAGAGRAA